jgi:uroporphyrin-III C-methyltransferase / precorrin-2 dehydrogenase / sirohydrochlorin ferrochelatase
VDRLPLFLDVRDLPVLIVGGGPIAARKCRLLRSAGAAITVVAPRLTDASLQSAVNEGQLRHVTASFHPDHLTNARLVIAATGLQAVNVDVAAAAQARGIWVNVVDDAKLSSAIVPSIVDRSPVIVAISTGGASPVLARRLRARLEALLEPSLGALANLLATWRHRLRVRWPQPDARRQAMDQLLDGELPRLVANGQRASAENVLRNAVDAANPAASSAAGHVTLVGAGPGDPGLLTLKALQALQRADVILHDRLVPPAILALARRDADLIDVGKMGGGPSTSQDHIHDLLLAKATAGHHVVRLKGGDSFIFGRGSEEVDILRQAGIEVDVVPGITAALALSLAGIALTSRGSVAGVRLLTAQRAANAPAPDWQSWAESQETLVIYMATASLPLIRERLLHFGMRGTMPVAVVENLSLPAQRVVGGTLNTLVELVQAQRIGSPSILVIGEVAANATLTNVGASDIAA